MYWRVGRFVCVVKDVAFVSSPHGAAALSRVLLCHQEVIAEQETGRRSSSCLPADLWPQRPFHFSSPSLLASLTFALWWHWRVEEIKGRKWKVLSIRLIWLWTPPYDPPPSFHCCITCSYLPVISRSVLSWLSLSFFFKQTCYLLTLIKNDDRIFKWEIAELEKRGGQRLDRKWCHNFSSP